MKTDSHSETRSSWLRWADFLRRHGLENLTAWVLEASSPLSVLGAQALYIAEPFIRPTMTEDQREALANLLEDHDEALAFAALLREEILL